MGDGLIVTTFLFQPVPNRHTVAQVPKAQLIAGRVLLSLRGSFLRQAVKFGDNVAYRSA